jgi:hypothetical protein
MANQLNTGSLDSLQKGQTLLVDARKVAGGKIQLGFAEIIKVNDRGENVLSILNKSDDRFSSNARRSWSTAEPSDAEEVFGLNFGADAGWYASEKGEMLELNVLNPKINGTRLRVIVDETTEPTEWQADNLERSAKRKGKNGAFITNNGDYIFSNTEVILTDKDTDTMHVFLAPDNTTIVAKSPAVDAFTEDTMM